MELISIEVRSPEDLEPAVDTLVREGSENYLRTLCSSPKGAESQR
jgi:hypothetical protein